MTQDNKNRAAYRDVIRFTWHYWRQKKWLGIFAALLMIMGVATDSIVPVYTGRIVDAMAGHRGGGPSGIWPAFWGFAALALLHQVFRSVAIYLWNIFAVDNMYRIVTDGMRKVQRFSADWHANAFAGGTVRKITRGMWAFDTYEDTLLFGILPAITIMIGVTVMLSIKMPLVGAISAALILAYCAFSIWASVKIMAPRYRESAEQDTRLGATLADIITGNPTVKSFGAEGREESLFSKSAAAWKEKACRAWQTNMAVGTLRGLFRMAMTCAVIAIAIWLWKSGQATPGDIVLVITTFSIIGGYLRDIGEHIAHLQRSVSDMDDIVSFWLRQDEVADAPGAPALAIRPVPQRPLIVFDKVGFAYPGTGAMIYKDFSIEIAAGEKLALVGPSGSGKSTFVKLLQRLYNLSEGRILIDGQDISRVTLESLRRAISLVPQDPVLFHRSLAENIAYGHPGAGKEEIVAAAVKAHAHEFIAALPLTYDTVVGERGVKLSGGERQRVAIARAVLADAPILILDEATSSLDSVSEFYIQKALQTLMAGRTTITIAHRLSTIQQADRILVFEHGRIVEQGDHRSLLANPHSHYKKLYDMQALGLLGDESAPARPAAAQA